MHEAIIRVCGECVWRAAKCLLLVFQTQNIRKYEEYTLPDHTLYLVCPEVFSLVGEPLSGDGCGSPNHI